MPQGLRSLTLAMPGLRYCNRDVFAPLVISMVNRFADCQFLEHILFDFSRLIWDDLCDSVEKLKNNQGGLLTYGEYISGKLESSSSLKSQKRKRGSDRCRQ